jgi:hypothetical protein
MNELRRENKRLTRQLEQAELIIEAQKKLSQILGITLERPFTHYNYRDVAHFQTKQRNGRLTQLETLVGKIV